MKCLPRGRRHGRHHRLTHRRRLLQATRSCLPTIPPLIGLTFMCADRAGLITPADITQTQLTAAISQSGPSSQQCVPWKARRQMHSQRLAPSRSWVSISSIQRFFGLFWLFSPRFSYLISSRLEACMFSGSSRNASSAASQCLGTHFCAHHGTVPPRLSNFSRLFAVTFLCGGDVSWHPQHSLS